MKIEDGEVTGAVISTDDGRVYLRLASPVMPMMIGLPSAWYKCDSEGWQSVPVKDSLEDEAELEREYQELVKEVSQ